MDGLISTLLSYGSISVWLIVLVASLIIEGMAPGLVTIWFAGGALVAMLCSAIGAPVWLQVVLFLIVSITLLVAARPLMSRWLKKNQTPTNIDSVIGAQAKVVEDINNIEQTGAVSLQGKTWTARNADESVGIIEAGTIVKVVAIQGVKLLVEYK